ncbi:hypothetical protein LTR22_025800 [Elasticomyces elasticus]|nr:hypothetical protein LTR22_025800 [Elasticomyces elasticus]
MRLLNVHTISFKDFRINPPKYAIASHRWIEDHEVSLQDMEDGRRQESAGYHKVLGFREFTRKNIECIDWVWVDTCCIDNPNPSELSEAINFMFEWYRNAHICLAYLPDVSAPTNVQEMWMSDWFKRGWTLQELLAPRTVIFRARDWRVVGYKGQIPERSFGRKLHTCVLLEFDIARITSIPEAVLHDYEKSRGLSVEQKLGWMANRATSRPEDTSYCLLGILNAKMVVNYGEGRDERGSVHLKM